MHLVVNSIVSIGSIYFLYRVQFADRLKDIEVAA